MCRKKYAKNLWQNKVCEQFLNTPWKTNMSPENHWLEDVFPIKIAPF